MKCAACNAEISTGSKYCSHCGHSVFNGVDASDKNSSSYQPRSEPERRQLTVMFCDLVESTSLADRHDPEDLRELILAYQNQATEVVKRYEGFVARYVGDGLLVYFGYPEARGNDAERAVYAALDASATKSDLKPTSRSRPLSRTRAITCANSSRPCGISTKIRSSTSNTSAGVTNAWRLTRR